MLSGSMIAKCLIAPLILLSTANADILVKPAGLQIVYDDGGDKFGGFRTFNSSEGINIEFHLTSDGASFVGLDQEGCDLSIGGVEAGCMFFGQDHEFSKDKQVMRVKFDADGAEAKDGKIKVSGHLSVLTASKLETAETKMLAWKKGAAITFAGTDKLPTFQVTEVGKPKWGDDKWSVTIQAKESFQAPVRVYFEEADGTRHEARKGGSSRTSFVNNVTIELEYRTKSKIDKAKMVVEYWADLKKEKVPVDLELGL